MKIIYRSTNANNDVENIHENDIVKSDMCMNKIIHEKQWKMVFFKKRSQFFPP